MVGWLSWLLGSSGSPPIIRVVNAVTMVDASVMEAALSGNNVGISDLQDWYVVMLVD